MGAAPEELLSQEGRGLWVLPWLHSEALLAS